MSVFINMLLHFIRIKNKYFETFKEKIERRVYVYNLLLFSTGPTLSRFLFTECINRRIWNEGGSSHLDEEKTWKLIIVFGHMREC